MRPDERADQPGEAGMTQGGQVLERTFINAFAERWHEAWNSHDPSRVAALCTTDVVLEQSSSPTMHGHAGVEASVRQLARAFSDYRFEPTEPPYLSADGRKAIVPWRMHGTLTGPLVPPGFAPTGEPVTFDGDDHWEFRDGLLARCRILFDANDFGVQVGAAPPPGTAGEKVTVWLQRLAARRMRARAHGERYGPGSDGRPLSASAAPYDRTSRGRLGDSSVEGAGPVHDGHEVAELLRAAGRVEAPLGGHEGH